MAFFTSEKQVLNDFMNLSLGSEMDFSNWQLGLFYLFLVVVLFLLVYALIINL